MSTSSLPPASAAAIPDNAPTLAPTAPTAPAGEAGNESSPPTNLVKRPKPRPKIEDYGFSVVKDIEGVAKIADIVFVHGLQGHPEETFTAAAPKPPGTDGDDTTAAKKSRNPLRFFKKSESSNNSSDKSNASDPKVIFWPFDLLSEEDDMKSVRILTWGYNSKVTEIWKAVSHENISQLGQNLLVGLQQVRKKDPDKPLIFVAHSLGGILVKNALHRSRTSVHKPEFLPIYKSTVGIVFLGTPQSGSGAADWGLLVSNLSKLALRGRNTKILKGLSPNNELLENLSEEFLKLLGDSEPAVFFHSFYETKGMSGLYGLSGEVIPRKYAVIGHLRETVAGIDGNHSEVCKFDRATHAGYISVRGALEDYVAKARSGQVSAQAQTQGQAGQASSATQAAENAISGTNTVQHYGNNLEGGVGVYGNPSFSGPTILGGTTITRSSQ